MKSEEIKDLGRKSGFDLIGITSCEPIAEANSVFLEWIKNGYNSKMDYMEKNQKKRLNPKEITKNCKSLICLGLNYYTNNDFQSNKTIVSKYAKGKDYHKIIERKLKIFKKLVEQSLNQENLEWFQYVDYGPVLERSYAMNAGLGFIGRNKNLITKEFGSWVFLASVITNIDLEFDTPGKFACGTCRACIDACPTKALIKSSSDPWDQKCLLDANKCISYQTIENKTNTIPKDIRQVMDKRVFGCDICQEVCPHNRKPKITVHEEFKINEKDTDLIKIEEIMQMNENDFLEKYKGTPIMRAKLKGIKRNIKHLI